ncbi:MAG: hypothetical protein LBQ84_07885 [Flavobacteriaceae bacterium]|jgi:hypothetical protein|nr:hypothetical protein [Flavobacteriaceae bacterium]
MMFAFKFIAVQEYIHIKQHKESQTHQNNCQVCHTIFQAGKYQVFEVPDVYCYNPPPLTRYKSDKEQYNYLYFKDTTPSELYNRPPPVIS